MGTTNRDQEIIRFTLKGVEVDRQNISLNFYRQQLVHFNNFLSNGLSCLSLERVDLSVKPFGRGSFIQDILIAASGDMLNDVLKEALRVLFKVIKGKLTTSEEPDFMLGDNLLPEDTKAKNLYIDPKFNIYFNGMLEGAFRFGVDIMELRVSEDPDLVYVITRDKVGDYFVDAKSQAYLPQKNKGQILKINVKTMLTFHAFKGEKVSSHLMWDYVDETGKSHPLTLHPSIVDNVFAEQYTNGLPDGTMIEADLYVVLKHVKKYRVQIARIDNVRLV